MVELRQRYVDALVAGDQAAAVRLVEDSDADVRSLYLDVLQPALYEIGHRWEEAEISVAQEHLATATTQSLMARLAERFVGGTRRGRKVLIACADGELHSIGVRMIADFLDADGWDVLFVGALSPSAAVADLARAQAVDVVALSAALPARVPELVNAVRVLRALEPPPVIAVGGQAFAGDATRALETGADLFAADAAAFAGQLATRF
ncbi:cobalamin-dependent protein [Solirubrobacter ginsenosidimutans]|uniref:Cobalamin-dependent protein n=1 Tax=Solirubrobacter ginsenosidimutans TaxID=490573 RepID=A0A9X3MT45_9ACTN|nr:cobalamin-dependent protein [Solirubrobacter ginsenosidimutans]MDA0161137.1 cobalamin-dependent protein [Solirubrobacter ginsenosidimutans]